MMTVWVEIPEEVLIALSDDLEAVAVAGSIAFEWLALHSRHSPTCQREKSHIVPDGARHSGLAKDYGGRYATDEELERIPCTCGLAELQNALCHALALPRVQALLLKPQGRCATHPTRR